MVSTVQIRADRTRSPGPRSTDDRGCGAHPDERSGDPRGQPSRGRGLLLPGADGPAPHHFRGEARVLHGHGDQGQVSPLVLHRIRAGPDRPWRCRRRRERAAGRARHPRGRWRVGHLPGRDPVARRTAVSREDRRDARCAGHRCAGRSGRRPWDRHGQPARHPRVAARPSADHDLPTGRFVSPPRRARPHRRVTPPSAVRHGRVDARPAPPLGPGVRREMYAADYKRSDRVTTPLEQ